MVTKKEAQNSLTHQGEDFVSMSDIQEQLDAIKKRLQENSPSQKNQVLLKILEQLSEFEFGRFLIKNSGAVSGYWTHYAIQGFKESLISSPLEDFILNKAPIVLATRERFKIFQSLLKENIKSHNIICSIPCGLMQDLQTLELSDEVMDVIFVGIDLDQNVLDQAKVLAEKNRVKYRCDFFQRDAWNLKEFKNQFDIVTSNGLNLYEKDNDRVVELYKSFYETLRPGGKFIGSGLSCPPVMPEKSEWDIAKINLKDLMLQKNIFSDILQSTWNHFRSSSESIAQLEKAGFTDIQIYWDTAKIFYTFEAKK